MKNNFKKLFVAGALLLSTVTLGASLTSCKSNTKFVDYASQTRIATSDWKTSNFIQTGTGIVTLYKTVDGDTAHFYCGSHLIPGRFNGIDTPESTGTLEKWGKQASNFTSNILLNAKTIVLETEPSDNPTGPSQDSNGRYLVWVWASNRAPEEEDGSQLHLVNLQVVQEGFSETKKASGSAYSEALYNADLQAQKLKLHIYSNDKDDLFYEGKAINDPLNVYQHPENYNGRKVYLTGIVTRTMGTNAYIQQTFTNSETDEVIGTYGMYIFTQYQKYDILSEGNEIAVTGTISERYGAYQLVDVSYSNVDSLKSEDDMKLLSSKNKVEPLEITASEANTGKYMNVLVTIKDLTATGGYGGYTNNYNECLESEGTTNEYCASQSKNSMTIFTKQDKTDFSVRIDDSVFIKNTAGVKIKDYKYFVSTCSDGTTLTLTGVMGSYLSEKTNKNTIQLMLLKTSDVVYNRPNNA